MIALHALTEFVREHPGCTVGEVAEHFGVDLAQAWEALIPARGSHALTGYQEESGLWHFEVTP